MRVSARTVMLLLFLAPVLVTYAVLSVFPYIYCFYISGHRWTFTGMEFNNFQNYVRMFSEPRFFSSFPTTAILLAACFSTSFVLGLVLALLCDRAFWGEKIFRTLFVLPMVMTPIVTALLWKLMLLSNGIVNYFIRSVGFQSVNWLGDPLWAKVAIVVIDTWGATSWIFLIFSAGLKVLPREPLESAMVDGASPLQTIRHITLPMLRPLMLLVAIMRFNGLILMFETIYGLTGGGPGTSTETINILAYLTSFTFLRFDQGSAIAMVIVAILLVTSFLYIYILTREGEV